MPEIATRPLGFEIQNFGSQLSPANMDGTLPRQCILAKGREDARAFVKEPAVLAKGLLQSEPCIRFDGVLHTDISYRKNWFSAVSIESRISILFSFATLAIDSGPALAIVDAREQELAR